MYKVRNNWLEIDEKESSMLKIMENCRIFYLTKEKDGFEISESCDEYFRVNLTKEQLLALADEIKEFANS